MSTNSLRLMPKPAYRTPIPASLPETETVSRAVLIPESAGGQHQNPFACVYHSWLSFCLKIKFPMSLYYMLRASCSTAKIRLNMTDTMHVQRLNTTLCKRFVRTLPVMSNDHDLRAQSQPLLALLPTDS